MTSVSGKPVAESKTKSEVIKMVKLLRGIGINSDVAYLAGFLSIGASVSAWAASRKQEKAGADKAERWGIFVGLWAPTFMQIGNALKFEEK